MRQGLFRRDMRQILTLATPERPARSRDPQFRDGIPVFAEQALIQGTVFGIDGHERFMRRVRHDEVAPDHKRFFVRQSEHLADTQRLIADSQADGTHHGVDDEIDRRIMDELQQGGHAEPEFRLACSLLAVDDIHERCKPSIVAKRLIADDGMGDTEFAHLFGQFDDARMDGKSYHIELVVMLSAHVERLGPDGSRRADDGYTFLRTRHTGCTHPLQGARQP